MLRANLFPALNANLYTNNIGFSSAPAINKPKHIERERINPCVENLIDKLIPMGKLNKESVQSVVNDVASAEFDNSDHPVTILDTSLYEDALQLVQLGITNGHLSPETSAICSTIQTNNKMHTYIALDFSKDDIPSQVKSIAHEFTHYLQRNTNAKLEVYSDRWRLLEKAVLRQFAVHGGNLNSLDEILDELLPIHLAGLKTGEQGEALRCFARMAEHEQQANENGYIALTRMNAETDLDRIIFVFNNALAENLEKRVA